MTMSPTVTEQEIVDRLRGGGAAPPAPEALDALARRLADEAEATGYLDVATRTVDSPIGPLLLAATPAGLVRLAFAVEGHEAVLQELAARVSPRVLHAPRRLDDAARQLGEYFDRRRRHFELPVDLRLAHGFRRAVLDHLRDIPYGTTASYTAVAGSAGRPAAVRAAASACSHNPVPVVIPCHRVVRRDGSVGQYRGGAAAKERLLALETAGPLPPAVL